MILLQIEAIKDKYKKLEAKFTAQRNESQTEINWFIEEIVTGMHSDLTKCRRKTEARLQNSHQVSFGVVCLFLLLELPATL